MSRRQTFTEHATLDKDVNNFTTVRNAPVISSQSVPGIENYSSNGTKAPPPIPRYAWDSKDTVYVKDEKDTSGNEKKTQYWICCRRTVTSGRKEYRLKDKKPENWNGTQDCNGGHEGYWVAEDKLAEWI